jgi:hypothetical protein
VRNCTSATGNAKKRTPDIEGIALRLSMSGIAREGRRVISAATTAASSPSIRRYRSVAMDPIACQSVTQWGELRALRSSAFTGATLYKPTHSATFDSAKTGHPFLCDAKDHCAIAHRRRRLPHGSFAAFEHRARPDQIWPVEAFDETIVD